jgi:hypothetical protein
MTTLEQLLTAVAMRHTRSSRLVPAIGVMGLPGRRVEPYRAGMMMAALIARWFLVAPGRGDVPLFAEDR